MTREAPRVLLAHDYLTQRGGAERVVLAMSHAFPEARIVTSMFQPDLTFDEFRELDVRSSWLAGVPPIRVDPRRALPFLTSVWGRWDSSDVDVVLCSSSGWAHALQTDRPKVVYCHNPARWLYQSGDYLRDHGTVVRSSLRALSPALASWDRRHAADATTYIANSRVVADRIAHAYGRRAEVVAPPRGLEPDGPAHPPQGLEGLEPGYLLSVGRTRGYKNTALVAQAVAGMPQERLVQVGGMPPGRWPDRLVSVSGLTDPELRWLYRHAGLLVAMSLEDFGLTPVEAYAFGVPSVVLQAGGYLDSTLSGVTGVFAPQPEVECVQAAIREARARSWDADLIRTHADLFSPETFQKRLQDVVADAAAL